MGVLLYVLLCARYPFAVGWMGEVQGCAVLADVCILHIVYTITSSRIITRLYHMYIPCAVCTALTFVVCVRVHVRDCTREAVGPHLSCICVRRMTSTQLQ
jgi:hypothetical protein